MHKNLFLNLKSRRNSILAMVIIMIAMLFTAQYSYQSGFSRGAASWRDTQSRFYSLEKQAQKDKQEINKLKRKAIGYKIESQQTKHALNALEKNLNGLQRTNKQLSQENALYKHILAPEHQQAGIQINSVQIYPQNAPGRFRYEILLAKFSHQKTTSAGKMKVSLQGVQDDELIQIPFEVLSNDWEKGQPFKIRYFQSLQGQLQLPEGFVPESVQISLLPDDKKQKAITEDFPWLVSIG